MQFKKHFPYIITIGLVLMASLFVFFNFHASKADSESSLEVKEVLSQEDERPKIKKEFIEIKDGDTYGKVMERAGIDSANSASIYEVAKDFYDLAQIRVGYSFEFIYGYDDGIFQAMIYKPNTEEQLRVELKEGKYEADFGPIPYETKIVTKEGVITSSLYEAASEHGIDERAIIALADTFQWTIDFAMDPRVGDTFRFIYEEKYLDGEYILPGKILAGKYINDGKTFQVFHFDKEADNIGYFDENGNSVQKLFLKAPVSFKYISSGFTTGKRYVEAFNVSTGHRAVDYAAAAGTPIRSVGDGSVTLAGWNGSYGYMVSVRHNGTYSTNYAHMSKMAVKRGTKVKQGDIIGYVGSTGFSTGPHLHYEMLKNGVKINPLAEVMPPGQSLGPEMKNIFLESIKSWQEELNK